MKRIMWQYCERPNDVNIAMLENYCGKCNDKWLGLKDASQIISITYDTNFDCYVVFWSIEVSLADIAKVNQYEL